MPVFSGSPALFAKIAAGLAGVKPNAESFMQESTSCFLLGFFYLFYVVFAVMRR